jgi:predicted O-methyltransferase YrrM
MHTQDYGIIFKVLKCIGRRKHKLTLLELGAGTSTVILASMLRRLSLDGRVISIEAEMDWVNTVQSLAERCDLSDMTMISHVSYRDYKSYSWFDEQVVTSILSGHEDPIDVMIIDAPPDTLCPHSRKPAIPFLLEYLGADGVVILHDAKRRDESEIIEHWTRYFHTVETMPHTPLGLALFRGKRQS